jgi:hypothetical protein
MRLKLTLACACAYAFGIALAGAATLRAETTPDPEPTPEPHAVESMVDYPQRKLQKLIDRYRHETWRWQRVMGQPLTRNLRTPPVDPFEKIDVWKRVATRARKVAQNPPHKGAWLCIQRYEGAWNDPNPPYYGGLQMDLHFQRTYGLHLLRRKGTADNWTPLEQMWVAERAHRSGRGFYPWPNTARYCGLI